MPLPTKLNSRVRINIDKTQFDPALLNDEVVLENALCILEGHFQNPAVDQESLIRDLCSVPNLFEFLFSALGELVAQRTIERLIGLIPTQAAVFNSSVHALLLSKLSHYFWLLDYPSANLRDYGRSVQLTRPVLDVLSALTFGPEAQSPTLDNATDELDGLLAVKRTKQKERKKAKRATRAVTVDSKPFDQLGVGVPTSQDEAVALQQELLDDLKEILTYYLDVLREPKLFGLFRKAYIKEPVVDDDAADRYEAANIDKVLTDTTKDAVVTPSAFPLIQPIKAAFYFDSVDGFGDWRILISTRADRNLREARRSDQKLFKIILKKIKELSNGHFSDDNQKRLTGSDNEIPIYEAKMTRDTRLVYQVDCIKEFEADIERQVLRIFGIYTHAQLERGFWDAVSQHLAGRGKEYKKRCVYRSKPLISGDKVFSPATFPPNSDAALPSSPTLITNLRAEDQQELHALLVLEKFVTFSQALLNSILADQDVAHVFHMSPAEQDIVKHVGSCFVLGRSGTGKTTTMLFKMLGIEKACDNLRAECKEDFARPRQLFVTQSRVLAEKVEEYYAKLAASHAAALRTAEQSTQLAAQQHARDEQGLVDRDEEEFWRGSLPKAFSELKDEHFPLFITFDHLCRLLEGDLGKSDIRLGATLETLTNPDGGDASAVASDYMLQRRDSFVSYGTFLQEYWPHLPQTLTKNSDPALIFAEFMGVIKGSEESLESENGCLNRDQYLGISHRQQGTFASRRDAVFTLFQSYLKLKRERRHWDAADRTHAILAGLRNFGVPGKKLDFVYVDEAQDNLLIDALVLRTLCKNPDGLFWAGDTAQTISVGSSFRFDDLKAFLYRFETVGSIASSITAPKAFQLTVNYRSHGGIVNCAHSVVQLITKFWPHAIDTLSEERGLVNGLRPVFFSGWDQDTVQYEQFLFGATGSQIEFGAQQCILVRDDAAREKLRKQVGDIGLVLTLYESKGLEFNDVLLYNFFEDSTVDVAQWRVILNALPTQKHLKCPQFDEARHSGVCRELKFLYVAITRARQNLWIADCSDKGEPLRTYWNARNLVDNVSAADNLPRLATTSSAEEWAGTARTLFDNRRYLQAMRSYERATMTRERDIAYAYYLREQARLKPHSRSTVDNPRKAAFIEAADAFLLSASSALLRSERVAYYRNSAECYVEASELGKAAKAYILAEEYTRAAQLYRQAGLFDEAVDTIKDYKADIRQGEAEKIINVAKLHYFKQQDLDRATRLFSDLDEALEFMEDYGFDIARVTLLERCGRYEEAAEIHLEEGRTAQAIDVFLKDSSERSKERAEASLLHGLWRQLSFGTSNRAAGQINNSLADLLALSKRLESESSCTVRTLDEVAMFNAIVAGNASQLRALGEKFLCAYDDPVAAALCLDFAFSTPWKIRTATPDDIVTILHAFGTYIREIQRLLLERDPCQLASVQKLFGLRAVVDSENRFHIPKGSFLHSIISQNRTAINYSVESPTATIWEVTNALQEGLKTRLKRKVIEQNAECHKVSAFRPCPAAVVLRDCRSNLSCDFGHDARSTAPNAFQLRVRAVLQQIMIYQSLSGVDHRNAQDDHRRFWLSRLYHTLFPVHAKLGSIVDLEFSSIPEAEKGLQVVREWIRDILYNATFQGIGRPHFLTFVTEIATLALLLDKDNAEASFARAPSITVDRPHEYVRNHDCYIVSDLLTFLTATASSSVPLGVLFLKTVLDRKLPIDANILCHIVEQLCATYVFSYWSRRHNSLHNLTLTRRWITKLYGNDALQQDLPLLTMLVDFIPTLLREMYYGGSGAFLLYEGNSIIDVQVRNILIARICKSFTVLGYNIPDVHLKTAIHDKITLLKRTDRRVEMRYPWIYHKYFSAERWGGLVLALRATGVHDSGTADEIVNLQQAGEGQFKALKGTRHVVYKRASDIPALLRGGKVSYSELKPDAPVFVPSRVLQEQIATESHGDEEDTAEDPDAELNAPPDEEDTGIDHTADLEAVAQAVDEGRIEQAAVPLTTKELAAAACLLRVYRQRISRKRGIPKKGLPAERNRWFLACRDQPLTQEIGRSYKLLYLGALPHVLVCLDSINEQVLASKKMARMRKDIVPHAEYENVMKQIDRAIVVTKKIRRLKDLMKPDSAFHRKQSIVELIVHVKEIAGIASELPEGIAGATQWDLQMAIKAIVEERKLPKPNVPKPSLVVDIDEFDYY